MDIVVTGPVATAGAYAYFREHEEAFRQRFSTFFMNKLYLLKNNLENIGIEKTDDAIYTEPITEGGVFGSLWSACETLDCGCEISLRKIPVLQEVVEITELMKESPYEMDSEGTFLVITEGGEHLCRRINEAREVEGLPAMAAVIGHTTADKARTIEEGDVRRFLVPPKRQKKDNANRRRNK